ncbi:MAG: discoidin domain-containing protein, partial [Pirellulaceae bacterium]|nr:discoidin domain-containing protein [Pirellulaceae bacterium]
MFRSSHLPRFVSFVVGMAVFSLAAGAMAQTNWIGAEASNWSDPSNWDNGVPDSTTDATIDADSGFGIGNPILDTDGSAKNLYVGVNADTHLTVGANTLAASVDIYLGEATGTTSTITQSGGTISCNMLYAGSTELNTSGVGNYTMTGGTLTVGILSLGNQGSATFTQSGGVVNNPVGIWLGDAKTENSNGGLPATPGGPGSATYTLSNNAVYNGAVNDISYIAPWGGYGVLTVQDNAIFTNDNMSVDLSWSTVAANAIINVHGNAQMTLTGTLTLAASELTTGTVNQDGGTATIQRIDKGLGAGTYNLTGGTLSVSKVDRMDLVNGGARVNAGETGAVSSLSMGLSGPVSNNIALGKTAEQSSNYSDTWAVASWAVDGQFDTMSHTNYEENAWWKVDLTGDDSNVSIPGIVLTARYDGYTWGLSNFFVRVLDKDGVTVAWQGKFIEDPSEILGAGEDLAITLPTAVDGRYVQVQLD